LIAFEE